MPDEKVGHQALLACRQQGLLERGLGVQGSAECHGRIRAQLVNLPMASVQQYVGWWLYVYVFGALYARAGGA